MTATTASTDMLSSAGKSVADLLATTRKNYLLPQRQKTTNDGKKEAVNTNILTGSGKPKNTASEDTAAVRSDNTKDAVARQYESMIYSSKVQRLSFSYTAQQAAAGKADTNSETASDGEQMTFDFYSESRSEELMLFQERVNRAASDTEDAGQQESLVQMSRRVASRFSMSLSLSGEALSGFAKAAEDSQGDGMKEVREKFLALANKLLEKADDFMNEFFSAFSGNVSENPQDSLQALVGKFFSDLFPSQNGSANSGSKSSQGFSMQISVQMEFSFEASAAVQVAQQGAQASDPLVLDLDGDGFDLTSAEKGADFDLLGTGNSVKSAFVTGGDAFLAMDRNGDGIINSGRELFGDQRGAANGFDELQKLDSNGNGKIDEGDTDYDKLLVWRDNGDGQSKSSELMSLRDAGIAEICLRYQNVDQQAAGGNKIAQVSAFRYSDGRVGRAGDALLNYVA